MKHRILGITLRDLGGTLIDHRLGSIEREIKIENARKAIVSIN